MLNVDLAASGGLFPSGQMFIAREAGPELVGTIGSRNAVVNNNQIVQSVSAGVYDAVKSAMTNGTDQMLLGRILGAVESINSKSNDTVLQVDSREIARAANEGNRTLGYMVRV